MWLRKEHIFDFICRYIVFVSNLLNKSILLDDIIEAHN
jgi:hypothetical protein